MSSPSGRKEPATGGWAARSSGSRAGSMPTIQATLERLPAIALPRTKR